jgi:hypothetical protein
MAQAQNHWHDERGGRRSGEDANGPVAIVCNISVSDRRSARADDDSIKKAKARPVFRTANPGSARRLCRLGCA